MTCWWSTTNRWHRLRRRLRYLHSWYLSNFIVLSTCPPKTSWWYASKIFWTDNPWYIDSDDSNQLVNRTGVVVLHVDDARWSWFLNRSIILQVYSNQRPHTTTYNKHNTSSSNSNSNSKRSNKNNNNNNNNTNNTNTTTTTITTNNNNNKKKKKKKKKNNNTHAKQGSVMDIKLVALLRHSCRMQFASLEVSTPMYWKNRGLERKIWRQTIKQNQHISHPFKETGYPTAEISKKLATQRQV